MLNSSIALLLLPRDDDSDTVGHCQTKNDYDGHMNLRILSVFILLISSGIGVCFPILASQYSRINLPDWCFFVAKFFGSGVIIATAFIHLLQPASEELGDPCLGGTFASYPWAFAICLMSLFFLFFTEIISHYSIDKRLGDSHEHSMIPYEHHHNDNNDNDERTIPGTIIENREDVDNHSDSCICNDDNISFTNAVNGDNNNAGNIYGYTDNGNIFEYQNGKQQQQNNPNNTTDSDDKKDDLVINKENIISSVKSVSYNEGSMQDLEENLEHGEIKVGDDHMTFEEHEKYLNQLVAVTILEAGVLVHSIFIGLSLAVTGEDFITLFIVIIFHQMFEGLGLGTRVAETPWPKSKRMTPWFMALAFTLTTPVAVAIGIGVRKSWVPGSRTSLIANGVFDAISAGILIYTGLVELMAHEFLYSGQFKGEHGLRKLLLAYFVMCCGTGLMALLGKWA